MFRSKAFKNLYLSEIILIIIATLYALISYWTPLAYDDWLFMAEWRNVNGDLPLSLTSIFEFWKEIRLYDNGRLANTFSPLSTMFSPWKELFPIMTGILVALIVYLSTVLAFSTKKVSPLTISIVWFAMLIFLPWRNSLFVADYSLNYIWAAALTLVFMITVVRFERKGWKVSGFILSLILAFLAGGWHEGFAIPTLCGFLLYSAKKYGRFSPQWYFVGVFYAAVAFVFLYCPGIIDRSQRQFGVANIGQSTLKMIFDFLPVIFLILIILATLAVRTLRKYLLDAWNNVWFVIGIGIIVGGGLLSLLFTHQPRSAFWPDLAAIIMTFILTRPVWFWLQESKYKWYIVLLVFGVCLIPMIFTIFWQYRLYKESEIIIKKIEASPSGTVYHDIIQDAAIPIVTLKMTNHPAWVTDFHFRTLREYTSKPYPAVIPMNLQHVNYEKEGVPLKGNANALQINGSIIIPAKIYENPMTVPVDILLKNGMEACSAALLLPYLTPNKTVMSYMVIYGISVDEIESVSL